MTTKDKVEIPFRGLSFKNWQTIARNYLEIMQGEVLGAEALYEGWYESGLSPYEAAELAFDHELDSRDADAVKKQDAKYDYDPQLSEASVDSFNAIEAIIEYSECWTMGTAEAKAFRAWLEAIERELASLAGMSLYKPGKWGYWNRFQKGYTPKQEAAKIYVAKLDN